MNTSCISRSYIMLKIFI